MRFMVIVKASKDSEAGIMPLGGHARRHGGVQRGDGEGGIMLDGAGLQAERPGRAHPASTATAAR